MKPAIITPTPVALSAFSRLRREPSRPSALRGADFDDGFDVDTLVFDAFRTGGSIIIIGPPLLNLEPFARDLTISADGSPCAFEARRLDRVLRLRVAALADRFRLESGLGAVECAVSPSGEELFAGRRVLLTLSQNNRLDWIQDWIRYHRDIHGADAALIYDNASSDYDLDALAEAISAVGGLKAAAIVSWPFKYGPQGGGDRPWDSDFCQSGALEHARWRFLTGARSVMNGDIDELVVGPRSVFAAAEASLLGAVSYYGYWLFSVSGGGFDTPPRERSRHRDIFVTERPRMRWGAIPDYPNRCRRKWTLVPARCPERAQWRVHGISDWLGGKIPSLAYSFRHLHPINTNWRYAHDRVLAFDAARHRVDGALKARLDRVAWEA